MPFTLRRLEWTTIAGLGLCAVAVGSYWLVASVPALVSQLGFGTALIGVKDSWIVDRWLRLRTVPAMKPWPEGPTPVVLNPKEYPSMPKLYQTLAEIQADLPDLVTVLNDFVAVSKLIEAKDVVGIIGSHSKWEADVVKLVNDIRGSVVVPVTAVADPNQTTLAFVQTPVVSSASPSGSIFVPTTDGNPSGGLVSLAAQAGLPESTR